MNSIYVIAASIPGFVFGLTFHEYAHARVAELFGDKTARMLGRVTLDPMRHLDVLGTLLFFLAGFGWAKPVPITRENFKGNKQLADIAVSLAGPFTNLLLAYVSLLVLKFFSTPMGQIGRDIVWLMAQTNIMLAALNLIPIPPLDGSHVLMNLWKRPPGWVYFFYNNGMVVMLFLVITGLLGRILYPVMDGLTVLLQVMAGLSASV
ncbi:MAG TPA: site-2 protease family protein [Bacillota bacterium]|nr:site-2 protease family protein [Bacillota bacterium]